LSGADAAAEATQRNAVAISGPFGKTIATRSPRPIPSSFSERTERSMSARKPA